MNVNRFKVLLINYIFLFITFHILYVLVYILFTIKHAKLSKHFEAASKLEIHNLFFDACN